MTKTPNMEKDGFDRIPFRMHPRVFAALGADLVTNDVVAVIELVKNSYDAFAQNVWLRFRDDPSNGRLLEIQDDGKGMTRDIIENVWCLVATPYKEKNPVVRNGIKERRVAGEKGLGRFSVARLGGYLHMLTQAPGEPCWEVNVNWADFSDGDDLSKSFAGCREYPEKSPFKMSGTRIRIHGLKVRWDDNHIFDLEENLGRLISPFSALGDFNVFLSGFGQSQTDEVKIESPEFLSKPKYSIRGDVDGEGNITGKYRYSAITDNTTRGKDVRYTWGKNSQRHFKSRESSSVPLFDRWRSLWTFRLRDKSMGYRYRRYAGNR